MAAITPSSVSTHRALKWQNLDLVCEIGSVFGPSNLWVSDSNGQLRQRMTFPVRTGLYTPPGPFAESFYMAERWLRSKRGALQHAIIHDLNYGESKARYGRGKEHDLILDLANAIAPVCKEPRSVDPIVVSVLLVRFGLAEFCRDYGKDLSSQSFSLERSLGINSQAANVAAERAYTLLLSGDWQSALSLYEEAIANHGPHMAALNDIAFIYATYLPGNKYGLKIASWVAQETYRGSVMECAVIDTLGWSVYRHGGDVEEAEKHLRYAFERVRPGDQYYITAAYHLMAVLLVVGKKHEAETIFSSLAECSPLNAIDQESYAAATALFAKGEAKTG
jgi:tetratricopeptide (TPR) repeat protein